MKIRGVLAFAVMFMSLGSLGVGQEKKLAVYDDFNHPWLDNRWYAGANCWTGYALECVREIRDGQLRLAVSNFGEWWSGDEGYQIAPSASFFADPLTFSGFTADLSFERFRAVSCAATGHEAVGHADMRGTFFNRGTTGDLADDVIFGIHFDVFANVPNEIVVTTYFWGVNTEATPVEVGRFPRDSVLRAGIQWDQPNHQFVAMVTRRGDPSPHQVFVPYSLSDGAAPVEPGKSIEVNALSPNCTGTRTSAHVGVRIDNVTVNRTSPVEVVFSNLGAGDTFEQYGGWSVYGSAGPIDTDRASPFVPAENFILDSVQAALTWSSGTNAGDIWLMSDAGNVPGEVLETFQATNLPAFGTTNTVLATVHSSSRPVLTAGVQYWVAVSAASDAFLSFNQNVIGDIGLASRDNNGPWANNGPFAAGAFRIYGRRISQ